MIHSDEKAMQAASKDQIGAMIAAYGAYTNATKEAGCSTVPWDGLVAELGSGRRTWPMRLAGCPARRP
jgi:hypothetical protein